MKRFLLALFASLIVGNASYASCYDDFSFSWKKSHGYAEFEIANDSNKKITITKVDFVTSSKEVMKVKNFNRYLGPFKKIEVSGVCSDGFKTTLLPAKSAPIVAVRGVVKG